MATINTNNMSVDSNGRVLFSGVSSGINSQAAIDGIMKAKQVQVDSINKKIDQNTQKLTKLDELKSKATALRTALSALYGKITADRSGDAFESKAVYMNSRSNGTSSNAPSTATDLIGVTASNSATTGSYKIEISQLAMAAKIRSNSIADPTAPLAAGGVRTSGTFTLRLQNADGTVATGTSAATIEVSAGDTLNDLRDRINAANTGASPSGISATVINVGNNQNYLVLTSTTEGADIMVGSAPGASFPTPDPLGLFDNRSGGSQGSITWPPSANATAGSKLNVRLTAPGTAIREVAIDAVDASTVPPSWLTAAPLQSALAAAGAIGVALTQVGGRIDLMVSPPSGLTGLTTTDASGALIASGTAGLTIQTPRPAKFKVDGLQVARPSNQITDIIRGVSLSLYRAEAGTEITLDVSRNAGALVTAIKGMVSAYNDLQTLVNEQTAFDPQTGTRPDTALLATTSVVRKLADGLSSAVANATTTDAAGAMQSLQDLGITVRNTALGEKDRKLLDVNDTKLSDILLNQPDLAKRLFAFTIKPSTSDVTPIGFTATTVAGSGAYNLRIEGTGSARVPALYLGSQRFAMTQTAGTSNWTVAEGPAKGLILYLRKGLAEMPASTPITMTSGVASQLFGLSDAALVDQSGDIANEVKTITDIRAAAQKRAQAIKDRLEIQRQALTIKFQNMETALGRLNSLKETLTSSIKALQSNASSN